MTPEQQARQQIDAQLVAAGWVVQDYKAFNPSAGRGNQLGGLGKAHQLFGEQLPKLLDELNTVLAS